MSGELQRFLAQLGRAAQLQTAAARLPTAQPGAMSDWSLEAYSVQQWQAQVTAQCPHGRIIMPSGGWLAVELDDVPGWHPFIAMAGEDAGRNFQVNTRFRWDGTSVEDSAAATFDSTFGRYIRLGTASDGTLAGNGMRARMLVAALDGQPWTVNDAWVGWVQSA